MNTGTNPSQQETTYIEKRGFPQPRTAPPPPPRRETGPTETADNPPPSKKD